MCTVQQGIMIALLKSLLEKELITQYTVSVKSTPGLQTSAQHETIPPCSIVQCMAVPCTAGQTEVFS